MFGHFVVHAGLRRPHCLAPGFLVLWLLGASGAVLTATRPHWSWEAWGPPPLPVAPMNMTDMSIDMPGVQQPTTLSASQAAPLDEEEAVVGICAGGRCRAYMVRAVSMGPSAHIINDLLGGVPVSVTYCNIHSCTRVFTGEAGGEALDLRQGGLTPGSMVLRSNGHRYRQDSGVPLDEESPAFPYRDYPGATTTWGAWQKAHPDTDLYVGADADLSPWLPPSLQHAARSAKGSAPLLPAWQVCLGEWLALGAGPLLILAVTLLIHILLAFLESNPRPRTVC